MHGHRTYSPPPLVPALVTPTCAPTAAASVVKVTTGLVGGRLGYKFGRRWASHLYSLPLGSVATTVRAISVTAAHVQPGTALSTAARAVCSVPAHVPDLRPSH